MSNTKNREIVVSGLRYFDMGLRLKYAGIEQKNIILEPDLKKVFNRGFTKYNIEKSDINSIDTPKNLGEFLGIVKNSGKDFFEISEPKIRPIKNVPLVKNITLSPPKRAIISLIEPSLANKFATIPPIITQLKKCGKVTIIWITFLTFRILNSLSNKAVKTAPKNEIIIFIEPILTVLSKTLQKYGSLNIYLKLSNPIHSEPKIPRFGK